MDEVDKNEQAERKHGFTTPETLAHAKKNIDPILEWAATGKLNAILEEIVVSIRAGKKITSGNIDYKMQNFASMGMRAGSSNAPEPAEGRKYREWSAVVIRRFGYMKFCEIIACIMNGKKCNFELFKKALQLYQN
tara:strand:- start:6510 stop:6914 length:405 start_codon:yes stop_codon:yes gene_type:complete